MADPKIIIRRSSTPGKVPTENQLALGELAINTYDGKLYLEQDQTSTGLGVTIIAVNPWSVGVGSTAYNTFFTSGNIGLGLTNPTSKLSVLGDVLVTGVVTASSFVGDGSGLTGVVATGSGVEIRDDNVVVGTASTIDFGSNLSVTFGSGIATISGGSGGESYWSTSTLGIHTLSNVGVGTTNPTSKLTVDGSSKISGILTVGTASYLNQNLNNGTIIAERIIGVHALSLPAGDYGIIGASVVDAFGISLFGFFDCLIEPMGTLSTVDLGSL